MSYTANFYRKPGDKDKKQRKKRNLLLGGVAVAGLLGAGILVSKKLGMKKVEKVINILPTKEVDNYVPSHLGKNYHNPVTLPNNLTERQKELAKRGNLSVLGIKGKENRTRSIEHRLNALDIRSKKKNTKLRLTVADVKDMTKKDVPDLKDIREAYIKHKRSPNNLGFGKRANVPLDISYKDFKNKYLKGHKRDISTARAIEANQIIDKTQKTSGGYYYYNRNNNVYTLATFLC